MEGAATLTTEASSTAMNCPVRTTASAAQGLRARRWEGRADRATALTTTSLAVQAVPGTRMVVYRPADEVTRDAIASLLAGANADARYPCWEAHQQRKASLAS